MTAEDYRELRTGCGAVALDRDVLLVSGADAVEYLQGQLSQDVATLEVGDCADSLILTPQGKLDAFVRVTRIGAEELIVDVDAGFGAAVATRLNRFKLRVKVELEPLDWRCLALRGPDSPEVSSRASTGARPGTALSAAFSWNGVSGVDLLGEAPEIPDGVRLCSVEAWESVRVEAGIPVMGAELDERTIAAEADLLDRSVSFTKGCYTGQELVARLDARGNRVARHLRGLVVTGIEPDPRRFAPGSEIILDAKVVGTVTSSAWSPALGCPVALGYVHRTVTPPATVGLRDVGEDGDDTDTASMSSAEVRTLPLA
ncbi:MAG TPA: glycine cleavage T C-terminal barrel domain-containing protein [Acidimicrobiales bacterium]|nr:glycine cleavage T C-terminal barrel domain-containing protein [Acidimicrobiales bacterium]